MAATVPFVALTRAQIRDSLLGYWSARYLAGTGTPLQIQYGSPAYMEADALGVIFESTQQRSATVANNIFPDTADTDSLLHHGAIDGIPQKQATPAVLLIQQLGTATQTITFGSSYYVGPNGLKYTPSANADGTGTSTVVGGGGTATVYATCTVAGTAGNLTSGTVVWSSTPANSNPTGNIAALQVTAADTESNASYSNRIVRNRQARPGSGNRSDVEAWLEAVANVGEGYVYPLLQPGTTSGTTLGCWTAIPLGAAPAVAGGGTVPSPRVLGAGDITNITGYIEGTNDALGLPATNPAHGTIQQLRPATTAVGDYSVELPGTTTQNVQFHVTLSGLTFPFVGTFTTAAGSSTTVINTSVDPTGTVHNGDLVAFPDVTVRGGYALRTVTVGASTLTVSPALGAIPGNGLTIYPAPANWAAMSAAVLSIMDRLGPGDTSPVTRWPPVTTIGPSTLYQSALIAGVMGVPGLAGSLPGVSGVLSVTLITPNTDVTVTAKQLTIPGKITFVP